MCEFCLCPAFLSLQTSVSLSAQGPACPVVREQHLGYTFLNLAYICPWTFVHASLLSPCSSLAFSWQVRCFPICLLRSALPLLPEMPFSLDLPANSHLLFKNQIRYIQPL